MQVGPFGRNAYPARISQEWCGWGSSASVAGKENQVGPPPDLTIDCRGVGLSAPSPPTNFRRMRNPIDRQ